MYKSAAEWRSAEKKRILLFGMSGLGKTYVSNMLRASGNWFHYSIDYRIGTRYMGELIADSFKKKAMEVPYLRDLLLSDSIYIASNITFDNLAPLSTYLGKPGNPNKGGLNFAEYLRRQEQHRRAEIAALLDTPHFVERAEEIYGYGNFVCDSGGSICEVVDPNNPEDPVLKCLSETTLLCWIEGSDAHRSNLIERFDRAPKPMYYEPEFLNAKWSQYLDQTGKTEEEVDPDAFVRWTYAEALAHRHPRYEGISNWGIKVRAEDVAALRTVTDFEELVAHALEQRAGGA
ncbi:MAG: ATPase [Rhodobacteraceae bacterium]|nr:ATPase [Paracoccaceae bacterium]